jgi:hypothetical protein
MVKKIILKVDLIANLMGPQPWCHYETFVTVSTDSRTVELIPNGREKDVTFENRDHYCDLVEQYRLHEFDRQAAAVRQGLACMVPYRLLSIFTWDQLEEFVCGKPTIDIALLR